MGDYTPDEATVKAAWSEFLYMESHGMKHVDDSGEEFDRMLARVRADALREAAEDMDNTDDPDAIHIANGDADLWLNDRADRIESGDGQ